MCGIAGVLAAGVPPASVRTILKTMTATLVHRGPDDEGFFCVPGAGLGVRRLSVIDLPGGHQPASNEDGTVQVILNGEIYNHPELRAELQARGHRFATRSDTEVIAHAYEEYGIECVSRLRGMFAIALWATKERRLLLARDRLGKKPLFYALHHGRFLFASEIKAILAAAPGLREPDTCAIVPYLRNGFLCEPRTMFRHVFKLPAAHRMIVADGNLRSERYWHLELDGAPDDHRDAQHWSEELDALLEESVRIRLRSDVPLGIFLSGGLDSSTITAYAHKAGLRPIRTFTIGFDRPGWDESADAERVARHFATEHQALTLRDRDIAPELPDTVVALARQFDEPFGDASALPTYYLSRLARQHVTVVLGGDGGDELLAGYASYQSLRFAEFYRHLPRWLGGSLIPGLAEHVAPILPRTARYQAIRLGKVLRDAALPLERGYFSKHALVSDDLLRALLTGELQGAADDPVRHGCPADVCDCLRSARPVVTKLGYADLRFRLLEDMLVKVDRMSMAHSLEVRSPFLDHRLVELLARMPPRLKLRGWEKKAVLRDTVRRYLPPETLRKAKQGFCLPLREWLRTTLREIVGDYLETSGSLPPELFDRATVRRLLVEHQRGAADHSNAIWLLLSYAAWSQQYGGA